MEKLKIYYKTEKEEYFKHHDIHAQYYIELDFKNKRVWWCFYLPLPKGMHWKAGDQMGGLGADHHTKTQSFFEFMHKPHLDIPKQEYYEAIRYIQNATKSS